MADDIPMNDASSNAVAEGITACKTEISGVSDVDFTEETILISGSQEESTKSENETLQEFTASASAEVGAEAVPAGDADTTEEQTDFKVTVVREDKKGNVGDDPQNESVEFDEAASAEAATIAEGTKATTETKNGTETTGENSSNNESALETNGATLEDGKDEAEAESEANTEKGTNAQADAGAEVDLQKDEDSGARTEDEVMENDTGDDEAVEEADNIAHNVNGPVGQINVPDADTEQGFTTKEEIDSKRDEDSEFKSDAKMAETEMTPPRSDASIEKQIESPKGADPAPSKKRISEERTPIPKRPKRGRKKSLTRSSAKSGKKKKEKQKQSSNTIPRGRGMKFSDIPIIRSRLENEASDNDSIWNELHKFLFRGQGGVLVLRGRVKTQDVRNHLLEFSGYLPLLEEGDIEGEELEKEVEVSLGVLNDVKIFPPFLLISRPPCYILYF